MKRICTFILLAFLLLFAGCAGPSILREGKPCTPEQYHAAAEPSRSEYFTVGFRLCEAPEDRQTSLDARLVHYDLVLCNKTDRPLKNVRITAGLSQKMCNAFANPIWYNEKADIAAGGTVLYVWEPQIILSRASGPMAEEMREMLIEISWDGGSELLLLHANADSMPEQFLPLLEDLPPLSGAEPLFPQERYATDQ